MPLSAPQPDASSPLRDTTSLRALWVATAANQLSAGMQQVILGWVVLSLTDSSGMVGLVFALRSAPNLMVGFAAGAITDRLDRRTIMRWCIATLALITLGMAWGLWLDHIAVWQVLVYATLVGALRACEMTARQAYVYDLVGAQGAVRGLAFNATAQRLGGVLGALLSGVLLEWWGASAAFLGMALTYGIGGALLSTLRSRGQSAPSTAEPLWHNMKVYVQALRTNSILQGLILSTAAVEVVGFSHQTLLPVLAKDVLQLGASGLGVLTAFRFVGGVLGAACLSITHRLPKQGVLLMVALVLFGVGVSALGHITQLWLAVLVVTGLNVMASVTDILHQSLLQTHVPNALRGRAMGSWIIGTGAAPMGHLEIGYLAGAASVSMALMLNGVALVLLPLGLMWLMPQLRRL